MVGLDDSVTKERRKRVQKKVGRLGWKVGCCFFLFPCVFASVICLKLLFQFVSQNKPQGFTRNSAPFKFALEALLASESIISYRVGDIGVRHMQSPTALVVTWFLHFSSGISPNAPGLHSVQIPFLRAIGPKRNRYVKWQNMFNPYLFFIQQKNYTKVGWDNSVIHLLQTWQSLLSKILWAFNVSTTKRRRKQCSLSSSQGKQVTNKRWYQTPMNSITISGIFLAQ